MPIYEFLCAHCQRRFEELVPMGNTGQGVVCPSCSAEQVTKLVSACNSRVASKSPACGMADACAEQGQNPHQCGGGCGCPMAG